MIVLSIKKFLRSLFRKGIIAAINFFGLCVGIVAIILVLHFVNEQLSYDQFLNRSEDIYRVSKWVSVADKETNVALTEGILSDFMRNEVVGVESATRILKVHSELMFTYQDITFLEKNGFVCDSVFLEVLEFDLLYGNRATALDRPNSIIVTKNFAIKCFGTFDVIDKAIVLAENGNRIELVVTGVLDNVPVNSSLQFEFLISGPTFPYWYPLSQNASPFYTFVRLYPGSDQNILSSGIEKFEASVNDDRSANVRYALQGLKDIHFNSGLLFDFSEGSNRDYVRMCWLLAVILSIVTVFNFINVFNAYAIDQVKGFAMQKIFGVSSFVLSIHILITAFLYIIFSLLFSLVIAELILTLGLSSWISTGNRLITNETIVIVLLSSFAIAVLSALYPLVLLTKIKLAESLKSKRQLITKRRFSFRNIILVSQVSLTLILLSWTALISRQLSFMQSIDRGYSTDNVICIQRHSSIEQQAWTGFYNSLKNSTSVNNLCTSQYYLFDGMNADIIKKVNGDIVEVKLNAINHTFLPTLEMNMALGRNFSEEFVRDTRSMIVNETAFSALASFESDLHFPYPVISRGDTFQIVGVVNDFHYNSFSSKIEPIVFYFSDQVSRNLYLKLSESGSIEDVKNLWANSGIDTPLEYKVLEDSYKQIMKAEVSLRNISYSFSAISIVITIISLLGFLGYIISKYKQVYAIKRVLGASVRSIFGELVTFQFLMIGIGIIISAPIIFYSMDTWLAGFAYKVPKSEFDFVLALVLILLLSIIITSILVVKYSKISPSVILREE